MAISRRRAAVIGALVVAVGALTVLWLLRPWENGPEAPSAAEQHARSACDHMRLFEELVRSNAPADRALDRLEGAEEAAARAAGLDPRWVPLASGISAVRVGFDADDPRATRVGIDVVRSECASAQLVDP